MSKKSRRRNRRLLKAAALLGGLALAARGRGNQMSEKETVSDAQKSSQLGTPKRNTVVKTPTTIQDSMPKVGMKKGDILPKNVKSKRITDKGEVYTIQDAKKGIPKKIGNTKTAFVNKDYIYQDGMPYTKGKFGTFKAKQEMDRGMLPPQLRNPGRTNITTRQGENRQFLKNIANTIFPKLNLKDGGKVVKTGEKVAKLKKKKPIQIRGFGKARRG